MDNSIGVFDSGVGGISTLKALVEEMPYENFIYYGDSKNNPYGEKSREEVLKFTDNAVQKLIRQKAKEIIIACNTATSVAINYIRDKYKDIPIVGAEPAIKQSLNGNTTLVMATPVTLQLEKYKRLKESLKPHKFIDLPCPGLAKAIETEDNDNALLVCMLDNFLNPYIGKVDNIVLGCTHYPFVAKHIYELTGVKPIDGNKGIAHHARELLEEKGLLKKEGRGRVQFQSSARNIDIMKTFFEKEINYDNMV